LAVGDWEQTFERDDRERRSRRSAKLSPQPLAGHGDGRRIFGLLKSDEKLAAAVEVNSVGVAALYSQVV